MIAVVKVRGSVNLNPETRETLRLLMLFKPNNMTLVPEEKQFMKMVEKVKDYVTFGKIDASVLAKVLEKRGRIGNKPITEEDLKRLKVGSYAELAEAILSGKMTFKQAGISRVFRLKPPRKGYERKGIKKPFSVGGALGNRREKINELIKRMI